MVCPHCKNNVKSINYICPVCGGNLYENPVEKSPLNEQEYIRNKLLELGLDKYKDTEDISEKEISKEDEIFLRLKTMDMIQRQEKHLVVMKNILIFFTVVAVIAIAFSIFISVKTAKEASSYSSLYSYEQSERGYKL